MCADVASLQQRVAVEAAAVDDCDGILARLTAMDRLEDGSLTLATTRRLMSWFMTALECLLILFKTLLALGLPSSMSACS